MKDSATSRKYTCRSTYRQFQWQQKLSYRKQIARQLRIQYADCRRHLW